MASNRCETAVVLHERVSQGETPAFRPRSDPSCVREARFTLSPKSTRHSNACGDGATLALRQSGASQIDAGALSRCVRLLYSVSIFSNLAR
jgi:hypothetical protein